MTSEVLAVVIGALDPGWDQLAQLGVIALALIVGAAGSYRFQVLHEREQVVLERQACVKEREARQAAEKDAREVRDVFIKEIVPAMTLQTDRSEKLLGGLQQVVTLVERVVTSQIGKT